MSGWESTSSSGSSGPLFDGTIRYPGYFDCPSKCRIRVFDPGVYPVVVCTELPDNPGISITNAAETVATLVWNELGRPEGLLWIEHYPERCFIGGRPLFPERFARVEFDTAGKRLVRPQWRTITEQEARSLYAVALP